MSDPSRSEELIEKKWDHCATNTLKKTSIGLATGILLSVFLFKSTHTSWVSLKILCFKGSL